MRKFSLLFILAGFLTTLAMPTVMYAQADPAKIFKANCILCHSADGSGDSATGKAMHAKDLRSEEVQKQDDATLSDAITKGKGKMPPFGAKIRPDDMAKLVAYIRQLPKAK
ncbi:MAG: cytochrome c6 [Acidobacteriaceae bacterium]|jgi:mono/diheme cytochrome c family protein